jgi:MoaA/NifB/PqqE/SkfB family radical SAM enzyme
MRRTKSFLWGYHQLVNRSLQGISYRHDLGLAKPIRIGLGITLRCNLKCKQCAVWHTPPRPELSTEDWKRILINISKWLGRCRVLFTGGEPFEREDLLELIQFSTRHHIIAGIATNGIVINAAFARKIVDSGMAFVNISLDGVKAETHDYIRGIKGTFEKTIAAIHTLNEIKGNMAVILLTMITGHNLDEIVKLVEWVHQNNLDGIYLQPLGPATDDLNGWHQRSKLWVQDLEKVDSVLGQLVDMKIRGARILNPIEQLQITKAYFRDPGLPLGNHCMVGITNIGISPEGDVHLCFKMPPIGNVKEMPLEKIWNSEKAREVRMAIKECQLPCGPQNFNYKTNLLNDVIRFIKYT